MNDKRELSLYIHIPFCKQKCNYCDFLSFGNCGLAQHKQYIDALCKEISLYSLISKDYIVQSIFFGGGTPSFVNSNLLVDVMDTIKSVFEISPQAEITLEGNPDSLSRDHLQDYKNAGFNRLSIGLQSANNQLLKVLGRVHNYDQFVAAFQTAREVGFDNINVDLMSGLPGQSLDDYITTLAKVVELQPEHISAYSLIVEEGTPLAENELLLKQIPDEDVDRKMYHRTKVMLENSGYHRYEISNYSKEGYECNHNKVYWTGGEYLGFGLGAASYVKVMVEGEFKTIRYHGVEAFEEYIGRIMQCESMDGDYYTQMYHDYEDNASSDEDTDDFDNLYDAQYEVYFGGEDLVEDHLREYRSYENNVLLEFIRDYYRDLHIQKRKDDMEEMMFLGLRMMQGVSEEAFYERFGVSLDSVYGDVIQKYIERGLLEKNKKSIALTTQGIDVSNMVMAEFML